jgi:hypothetical protein
MSVTLPITVTKAITNVAGLDLTLRVTTEPGAPSLTPTFNRGAQTEDWQFFQQDSVNPWRVALADRAGIKGPAELARVTFQISPLTLPGTVYTFEAAPAILGDEDGLERDVSLLISPGRVMIPFLYGDVTRDRQVDAQDLNAMIQMMLHQRTPNSAELLAGDTQPRPGLGDRSYGDGLITAADLNWLLRNIRGLAKSP